MPLNIAFPWRFAADGGTEQAAADRHIRDMIEQLVLTAPGERVNRPDFGSGLYQLLFAPNSSELATTVQFTLQAALQRYLGDVIDIRAVEVTAEDATLRIVVDYAIRRTGEAGQALLALPGGATP